ncbi:MATE family efflux transporter [Thalassotalea fusca]
MQPASYHRQLFTLAIPMILSNITVPLLGLVDTAVIGHLDQAYYLGGSSVGAMIITFVTWLCGFLRMSTTGLAAQAYGRGDFAESSMVLSRGLIVSISLGALMIIFQTLYLDAALALAGGSEQVQLYARQYGEIRVWGIPAALSNLVILGWLLGHHKAKSVMWILIVTNCVNLGLDLLFVVVFDWKVQGVALATLIAEYVGLAMGLLVVFSHFSSSVREIWQSKSQALAQLIQRSELIRYFSLNRDILIRTLCLEICFVFMTFQGARLGDEVVAANAILMNFLLLVSFGLDGIANAAEAMVGKAHGSENKRDFRETVKVALQWNLIFAIAYTLIFTMFDQALIRLISDIPSVIAFAETYVVWLILMPIFACWCYLFDGIYVGMMNAKVMRNSMVISTFFGFFPVWFILQSYGNHGLWAAFTVFMLLRGVSLGWHFNRYVWRAVD